MPFAIVYSRLVPKGMGLKSPVQSGCRTRQSMRHFCARAFCLKAGGATDATAGNRKEVRLALHRF